MTIEEGIQKIQDYRNSRGQGITNRYPHESIRDREKRERAFKKAKKMDESMFAYHVNVTDTVTVFSVHESSKYSEIWGSRKVWELCIKEFNDVNEKDHGYDGKQVYAFAPRTLLNSHFYRNLEVGQRVEVCGELKYGGEYFLDWGGGKGYVLTIKEIRKV